MSDRRTDHDRGCAGRTYSCTCGYDDERDAEIERLRELLQSIRTDLETGRKLRPTVEQALVDALEPPE